MTPTELTRARRHTARIAHVTGDIAWWVFVVARLMTDMTTSGLPRRDAFPPWFGRNPNALNDFMRDLDNMIDTALGKPPAPGYLTEIVNAQLLFADEPEAYPYFARCIPFYRDYYRDEASPTAAFGLVLSVPSERVDQVRARWLAAGCAVATVG